MAEMASWFKIDEGFAFLTDEDVVCWHENQGAGTESIRWDNFVGHDGLMKVFKIPNNYHHHEGFVEMPDVIRKTLLDGKMDMLFSHAGNLNEATPEFIPMMKRLANRFPHVENLLKHNPYRNYIGESLTLRDQMKVGVENGFNGSTVGKLIRHADCDEESMLIALKGATSFMDEHSDHHHYHDIIHHANVTRKVLKYIIGHIKHTDVQHEATKRLKNPLQQKVAHRIKSYQKLKVTTTVNKGGFKIRVTS